MGNLIRGMTIYLVPGDVIKIKSPVKPEIGIGFFVDPGPVTFKGIERSLIRGFLVEHENIGTITVTDTEEAAVIYSHKKAQRNAIWFFALTGERGVCNVGAIQVHDHTSIVQGGPAHGVYFSDYGEEEV